jgi:hypothetical protein
VELEDRSGRQFNLRKQKESVTGKLKFSIVDIGQKIGPETGLGA